MKRKLLFTWKDSHYLYGKIVILKKTEYTFIFKHLYAKIYYFSFYYFPSKYLAKLYVNSTF